MNTIATILEPAVKKAIQKLYSPEVEIPKPNIGDTRKEFEGDVTVVVFPYVKMGKKNPAQIGQELGEELLNSVDEIVAFNVQKGFLNLVIADNFWKTNLDNILSNPSFGEKESNNKKVLVEYSSPNTNKPLHLGHIRNILLGWSMANIFKNEGYSVVKTQIINDRGIAICKSMLAWQLDDNALTPSKDEIKGDHLVGKYYVQFDKMFQEEYKKWQLTEAATQAFNDKKKEEETAESFYKRYKNNYFNDFSNLGKAAKEMLIKWESNDTEIRALWKQMNGWVYDGFNSTYDKLKVNFDALYYESDTYLLGKEVIEEGLNSKLFYKKEDGSVWIDLDDVDMGQKILLRSDGTSVYMTQDLGTACVRYDNHQSEKMVYVVGDEQDYHFKVLFEIMKRMEKPFASGLHHLSYGMIDLPTGKMKSREGTVVDADDLVAEVIEEARKSSEEKGEIANMEPAEQKEIIEKIGLAALKYFIIKVNPKKRMVFDPNSSVDIQGHTGPYIQYQYVRTQNTLRTAKQKNINFDNLGSSPSLELTEKSILQLLSQYPQIVTEAANNYDPSVVANYCYDVAKLFSKFWGELKIFQAESEEKITLRLQLCKAVGQVLESGMNLIGIEMPSRM